MEGSTMLKRILSLFMSIVMVISMLPLQAMAEEGNVTELPYEETIAA